MQDTINATAGLHWILPVSWFWPLELWKKLSPDCTAENWADDIGHLICTHHTNKIVCRCKFLTNQSYIRITGICAFDRTCEIHDNYKKRTAMTSKKMVNRAVRKSLLLDVAP